MHKDLTFLSLECLPGNRRNDSASWPVAVTTFCFGIDQLRRQFPT